MPEVVVGRQHHKVVTKAEPCQERVNRSELHSLAAAGIPKIGCCNVIVAVRGDQRQGSEPLDDGIAGLRSSKALKQLLQHQARRHDGLPGAESVAEAEHFLSLSPAGAPQR